MAKEVEGLLSRAAGPPGVQYSLVAQKDGEYNIYSHGSKLPTGKMHLNRGEVWKYGETTSNQRYDQGYLNQEGVIFVGEYYGNQAQIKVAEKIKIYSYYLKHRHLPPGNKIFR
ncbi:hypothetical protein AB9P05_05415 [Roseivirga sp. BDSF3-8]|uniref:hypothetical protein n=1 Tax=Roseivirga sp. BDSF3-8 TaxID=3241598 RepID=UPI0035320503